MFRRLTLFFLALTGAMSSLSAPQPGSTSGLSAIALVPPSGPSVMVKTFDLEGRLLISVNEVAGLLGGSVEFEKSTASYEMKLAGHTVVFGVEAPLAVVDTKLISLSSPVFGDGPSAYAEPEFFQKVLPAVLGATVIWEKAERRLSVKKIETPELGVDATVVDFEGGTKVVLKISGLPPYKVEKFDDHVLIRFPGVKLLASPAEQILKTGRVSRLYIRGTDISVTFRDKGVSANVYSLASPPRLVVDVSRPAITAATPSPVPTGPVPPLSSPGTVPGPGTTPGPGTVPGSTPGPAPTPGPEAKTVILDPGHGGTENGARGPGGLLEKDAMLALCKIIKETLTARGYRVLLTREGDDSVALQDRVSFANAAKGDLFLSIHANASRASSAHGTEVYYLSLDATDRAAATVAEAENRQPEPSVTPSAETNAALRDLELILWDLAQNQHLAASSRLAEIIQADFNRLLGVATRGVKQAPFRVLIGTNVPAVLVEVAFITNPEEEKKLSSEEFRKEVAETLAGSLDNYFRAADSGAPVPLSNPAPALSRSN